MTKLSSITLIPFFFIQSILGQNYNAGFKSFQLKDSTRVYKPNTDKTDKLHYRPMDLDIWYPSNESKGTRLRFEDLFRLHEERANKYQDENDYTGYSDELILYLASSFGVEAKDGQRLLKVKTSSFEITEPAKGKFPVVIYMAGYNGMGWENFRLLERLAENGFVVVSISSIGMYPGDMTNSLANTMEQVYDAEFALKTLKAENELNMDFNSIGLLGLSWGSMSGIIMLDNHPEFKAMVSLDGSDTFYYGDTDEDDDFLTKIYDANVINPEKTTASFFHIEAGDRLDEFIPTGEYHYFKKINSSKRYLRFLKSKHADFGRIAWALKTNAEQIKIYDEIMESTVLFYKKHLNQLNGFDTFYNQLLVNKDITDEPYKYSTEKPKELIISGIVQDSKTKEQLDYVNIGILNKGVGTVSNKNGLFEFKLSESNINDTIRISMIGYKAKNFTVKNLINKKDEILINLDEEISELNEVVITAKNWKRKVLGNKTKSTFIGHVFYYEHLGKEMGIRMNAGRHPKIVESFNFHISYNRFSAKAIFRLNMYRIENGKPTENIIKKNILISVDPKQTGMISTDLRDYDIVLSEDVIATLEWIDSEGEVKPTEALIISVGLLTGGTYERSSKESKMKKVLKGMGLGFTMDVKY